MKKASLVATTFLFLFGRSSAQIISQYVETESGISPKGLEIWNNTVSILDFTTNNLLIQQGTNGGALTTVVTVNSGTLNSGAVLVIGTSDMQATAVGNGAAFITYSFNFNGNDALSIVYGGTTTDVFGTPGFDPSAAWTGNGVSTANQNIQLKSGITTGDTNGWMDPSERFETVSTTPSTNLSGIGLAPTSGSAPTILVDPTTLSGFTYEIGSGPSSEQTFTVSGSNLTNDISISASTSYEISLTSGSGYTTPLTLTQTSGTVNSTTIYVRLKAGLLVNSYNENIVSSSIGATTQNVNCDGSVTALLPNVLISEYVEGTSNNKALEIINLSGITIDLANENFLIEVYANGSPTPTSSVNLTGTLLDGDVFVIVSSLASAELLAYADQTSGSINFNGDDAIVLKKDSDILDVIGQIGNDPGTEWGTDLTSTADNTLRRKGTITIGDRNGSDVFDPSVEWDGFATDTFNGLGIPDPLPVELSSFSAIVMDNAVKLNWRTETEVSNYGFEVERLQDYNIEKLQDWRKIGFVQGHGNSNSPRDYFFLDNVISGKYSYRLKQIDTDGQFEYSKVIEVDLGSPTKFELSQNYPNPFNPVTTIKFSIPQSGNVKLTVYSLLGEHIAEPVNGFKEAGIHTINLDASSLNSGIYIYKIEANGFVQSRKMTLIK